ncbi:hypothetical protein A2769_02730 [Candidatus Daviesbacteria bacterium RIFCSPHIGHO2_01_FULL_37_27]|nr:MAG: hypothetical protein A2769_02730 [Candidatus Daviesbacteria bacterium RIFCSPHIGHO2_01_FULL_37_27]
MRIYSKYGEVIRRLRREEDWSQEKLAEESKLDPKTIIQIEGGKRNPTLKTLQKIANALHTSLDSLLKNP